MFRRALILSLMMVGLSTVALDAEACHRCRHRHGYGYSGCGASNYGCGNSCGCCQRVARVYRTVRVPVQTCTMTCVATCDPCGNVTYTSTPTYTTTYVSQRILVHSQVVGRGSVYDKYADGTHRHVAGSAYGYRGNGYGGYGYGSGRAPYRGGYASPYGYGSGLSGSYRMGGYGAAKDAALYAARYQVIKDEKKETTKRVGLAF